MSWFPRWRTPGPNHGPVPGPGVSPGQGHGHGHSHGQARGRGQGPVGFRQPAAAPAPPPIRRINVQWGTQRPQPATVGDLKEEIHAATAVPYGSMQVFAPGGLMADDRAPLAQYDLRDGAQVTLVGQPPGRGQGKPATRQGRRNKGGPASAPRDEARPTREFQAQQAAAAQRKLAEADQSEEGVMRRIRAAQTVAEVDLLPEMEQLERSVQAIETDGLQAVRELQQVAPQAISLTGPNAAESTEGRLNAHQIVLEQKKISELLLRQLLSLDNAQAPTDAVRQARKAAVRQVQAMLDRVDAAWTRAKALGVKPDM